MLDFLGIGAQKAGTTWLYEVLRRHPAVRFPAGKEVHFWDRRRETDMDWYRAKFDPVEPGAVRGEITPAYAILPQDVIREVRSFSPELRLLFCIRNPAERAWSAALRALERAEMELSEASDQWFLDHFRSRGSLLRGDYEQCLRNWRAVFGDERVLVLRYEDIAADPRGLLRRCCAHLGIDTTFADSVADEALRERYYAGPGYPIRPSLLPVLRELYLERIDRLADYLGTDLQSWKDSL